MTEEIYREKYEQLQLLDQQIQHTQQQLERIDQQIAKLSELKRNLDQIKKSNGDEELFIPVGPGIFVRAQLQKSDSVLLNVGADVCVEKSFDETKTYIDSQIKDITSYRAQAIQLLEKLYIQAEGLEKEAGQMVGHV